MPILQRLHVRDASHIACGEQDKLQDLAHSVQSICCESIFGWLYVLILKGWQVMSVTLHLACVPVPSQLATCQLLGRCCYWFDLGFDMLDMFSC